jgi:hypothetical protein
MVRPVRLGWREWISMPQLKIDAIKVKVDTGARSSSLHAYDIEYEKHREHTFVRFKVHPRQRNSTLVVDCRAALHDMRTVRSSSGTAQRRPVIRTSIAIGEAVWDIDLTLTSRDAMGFRMLLGREAIRKRFVVDPGRSFLLGKPDWARRKTRRKGQR